MNAKRCKQLRRFARRQTIGEPKVSYIRGKHGEARIIASCTRGLYRHLKRA